MSVGWQGGGRGGWVQFHAIDTYRSLESQDRAHQACQRGEKTANMLPAGRSQHGYARAVCSAPATASGSGCKPTVDALAGTRSRTRAGTGGFAERPDAPAGASEASGELAALGLFQTPP